MGLAERIFDGLRASLEIRGDLDRVTKEVESLEDNVLDHEKRLIRIETMIELSQNRAAGPARLPDQG